jgi:SAM-dependent methyltransferase
MAEDRDSARDYFEKLAPEYDRAFRLQGRGPLNAVVNRLFRGPTFVRRMRLLEEIFGGLGLGGRSVLDLGCGSGQVSLLAAAMGAQVRGIDIAPGMLALARESAAPPAPGRARDLEEGASPRAALAEAGGAAVRIEFAGTSVTSSAAPRRPRACSSSPTPIVSRTMALRQQRASRLNLYYHPMHAVAAAAHEAGLSLAEERREHAFTILVLRREPPTPAGPPRG